MDYKIQNRIYSFDVMRIIAACAVIMIHIAADFVKELDRNSFGYVFANLLESISRFPVPMFLMISGSLMLDEDRTISRNKMAKIILDMLILLFSWSFFYAISFCVIKPILFNEEISMAFILSAFFNGHYHMWYIYVLVGLISDFCIQENNAIL